MENQIRFEMEKQKRLNEIENELYMIDEDIIAISDRVDDIVYNVLKDESYLKKSVEDMENELQGEVDDELQDENTLANYIRPLRTLISLRIEENGINERKNNLIEERKLYNTQG